MAKKISRHFPMTALSMAIISLFIIPTHAQVTIADKVDLGTLKTDNGGSSEIYALSADGKVAGGWANNDSRSAGWGWGRATLWSGDNWSVKTDLGTLKADNSGQAEVNALSADGKMVSGHTPNDRNNPWRAILWTDDNWSVKTDLGTLEVDNTGSSRINTLSADGKVAGGMANNPNSSIWQATIWTGDDWSVKTNLGTLKADNSGWSGVYALSADGKVAGGSAYGDNNPSNMQVSRAILWHGDNWSVKTDLGTLRADNSGNSEIKALSADGKVAGGWANDDNGNFSRATLWHGDNWSIKTDLGTLRADNGEQSRVHALSADGKVAGGWATNDNKMSRATLWHGDNWSVKTDLGTLKADNSGLSAINALSADGKVAGGWATDNNSNRRATLWRVSYDTTPPTTPTPPNTGTTPTPVTPPPTTPVTPIPPVTVTPTPTPPTTPVVIAKIDVDNTTKTVAKLGADSLSLMSMQSHALDRLQYACVAYQGVCFGVQQDVSLSKSEDNKRTSDVALGANVGYGFGNGLSVGVSLDHSINRKLPDSYRHDDDGVGVGAVMRYQSPTGVFGEASGAYDNYTARITRPLLANTELGVNTADIKSVAYTAKVGKQFGKDDKAIGAYVGVSHKDISRDAYRENEDAAFPISYGKVEYKQTSAIAGLKSVVGINDKLSWVSDAQISQKLSGDDPTFTASLTGVDKYDFSHTTKTAKTTGVLGTGVRYQIAPKTYFELMPYVNKGIDDETGKGVVFRLEGAF